MRARISFRTDAGRAYCRDHVRHVATGTAPLDPGVLIDCLQAGFDETLS